jgi:glycosyltransferase involved in cell wall biosynthesis
VSSRSPNQLASLSAILIVKNEGSQIAECVETLRFCDEIVVVDNNSTDQTVENARKLGCKVIVTTDWPGFGLQKQRALDNASGEWILSIDADERVTAELQAELIAAISSNAHQGYKIKRKSQFLGKWMRFGGWYPDYVLRLARRESCRFDPTPVHEKLIVDGSIGTLKHHFLHYSYRSISDVLSKQKRYALANAGKIREKKGSRASILKAVLRSAWTFLRLYVIQLGLLDGRHGFISATFKSQEVFWKYVATEFEPNDRL